MTKQYFLISLYNKQPYQNFVRELLEITDYNLLASEGTARWCRELGLECATIEELFELAPRLSGQVKSLHPDIYTAVLQDPTESAELSINIAGVTVDLTPFCGENGNLRREKLDIGGVSLLRAAVKNYEHVVPLATPEAAQMYLRHYPPGPELKKILAARTLRQTLDYDRRFYGELVPPEERSSAAPVWGRKFKQLRYGENPHQKATLLGSASEEKLPFEQLAGDDLSYTNCLDLQAALQSIQPGETPEVAVIKHTNPTGWARGENLSETISAAWGGDPKSAYGGVVGLNCPLTLEALEQMGEYFLEAVVAPAVNSEVVERVRSEDLFRLVRWPGGLEKTGSCRCESFFDQGLCQTVETPEEIFTGWRAVSERSPASDEEKALRQMWQLDRWVTSNSAVVGTVNRALGVGAGQQSRVDAVRLAVDKLKEHHSCEIFPLVLASDGFFPFPDNVEVAAEAGVDALVAPAGSIRDEEVITAANELNVSLVFTDRRIFSH